MPANTDDSAEDRQYVLVKCALRLASYLSPFDRTLGTNRADAFFLRVASLTALARPENVESGWRALLISELLASAPAGVHLKYTPGPIPVKPRANFFYQVAKKIQTLGKKGFTPIMGWSPHRPPTTGLPYPGRRGRVDRAATAAAS